MTKVGLATRADLVMPRAGSACAGELQVQCAHFCQHLLTRIVLFTSAASVCSTGMVKRSDIQILKWEVLTL